MIKDFRAIGFSSAEEVKEIKEELENIHNKIFKDEEVKQTDTVEVIKKYGEHLGIIMTCRKNEILDVYPYLITKNVQKLSNVSIEEIKINGEMSLMVYGIESVTKSVIIFKLHNNKDLDVKNKLKEARSKVFGISTNGKVILPRYNNEKQKEKIKENIMTKIDEIIKNANVKKDSENDTYKKEGIEIIAEIEMMNMNEEREQVTLSNMFEVLNEYMVYDNENNEYEMMAKIENIDLIKNDKTNEEMYKMELCIGGFKFEIIINKNDLKGMPTIGMRFLGKIKLYGQIIK